MEAMFGAAVSIDSLPGEVLAQRPNEETPDWQRYLVWGLLALGGLTLSGIAWKLMKDEVKV